MTGPAMPERLVFDLELARPLPEVDGRPCFGRAHECGAGVVAAWSTTSLAPEVYLFDEQRDVDRFWHRLEGVTGTVSWNGASFDRRVLAPYAGEELVIALDGTKHVDLMAIAACLSAGEDPRVFDARIGVPHDWQRAIVGYLPAPTLFSGWRLDDVARATLDEMKSAGMSGGDAPGAWMAGRRGEVIGYCIRDVALTRALWLHAWEHGFVCSPRRGRVAIPREVL